MGAAQARAREGGTASATPTRRGAGRASMSNDPLASVPLMASAGGDPFHVVKDELVVKLRSIEAVSYTHLTLPTICSV